MGCKLYTIATTSSRVVVVVLNHYWLLHLLRYVPIYNLFALALVYFIVSKILPAIIKLSLLGQLLGKHLHLESIALNLTDLPLVRGPDTILNMLYYVLDVGLLLRDLMAVLVDGRVSLRVRCY
jgi:hypothetical protein